MALNHLWKKRLCILCRNKFLPNKAMTHAILGNYPHPIFPWNKETTRWESSWCCVLDWEECMCVEIAVSSGFAFFSRRCGMFRKIILLVKILIPRLHLKLGYLYCFQTLTFQWYVCDVFQVLTGKLYLMDCEPFLNARIIYDQIYLSLICPRLLNITNW